MRYHAFWTILGIAVCCLSGCGPKAKLVEVSGTVTYNGKPLNDEGCNIVFLGSDGKEVLAPVASSGEYKVSGVVAGPNKVAVFYRNPEAAKTHEPGEKAPASVSPLRFLPKEYGDVKTSGLTANVDSGTVFNVEMKGPELKAPPTASTQKTKKADNAKGKPHKQ